MISSDGLKVALRSTPGAESTGQAGRGQAARAAKSKKASYSLLPIVPKEPLHVVISPKILDICPKIRVIRWIPLILQTIARLRAGTLVRPSSRARPNERHILATVSRLKSKTRVASRRLFPSTKTKRRTAVPGRPLKSNSGKGQPRKWPGFTLPRSRIMPPLRGLLLLHRVRHALERADSGAEHPEAGRCRSDRVRERVGVERTIGG
jgi:hypothetical protein